MGASQVIAADKTVTKDMETEIAKVVAAMDEYKLAAKRFKTSLQKAVSPTTVKILQDLMLSASKASNAVHGANKPEGWSSKFPSALAFAKWETDQRRFLM